MSRRRSCVVVGAGVAGAAATWELHRRGWEVAVYEAEAEVGGNLRTATYQGIRYEPHGPHVFHTDDAEVYGLVHSLARLNGYRHRVLAELPDGRAVTWPLQLRELKALPGWHRIAAELDDRPGRPEGATFEAYAVSLMGPTLYSWFCEGYTWKQWGRDPATLSARFAPKRLDLRADGDVSMFRDRYQGYAAAGWETLVQGLLGRAEVHLNRRLTLRTLPAAAAYVVTAPLDEFLEAERLPWRGVRTELACYPDRHGHELAAPVVNHSATDVPWTRRVETRQMTDWPWIQVDGTWAGGTVIATEYPGADVRHYPVDDAAGENRQRHAELVRRLKDELPDVALAGRLANYVYVDMDQAITQGLNAARRIDAANRGD